MPSAMEPTQPSAAAQPATGRPALAPAAKGALRPAEAKAFVLPSASRPAAQSPVAQEPSDGDEYRRGWSLEFWNSSSSFLISTVVHLILLIVMALLTITLSKDGDNIFLASHVDGTADELEESTLEDVLDVIELGEIDTLPVKLEDLDMAALGDPSNSLTEAEVGDAGKFDMAGVMGEIGAPFGESGLGKSSLGTGTGGMEAFGIKASGSKFVFCIDGSKSMKKNGWEACKAELMSAVSKLTPKQQFYVMFFADKEYRMFGPDNEAPDMVPATEENIRRLYQWMYSFELVLKTKPYTSIKYAFDMKPSAIYLLSDGRFKDQTETFLRDNNKRLNEYDDTVPKMAVHTIAFYSNQGQEQLQRIAKANGGTFRFVPAPAGIAKKPKQPKGGGPGNAKKPNRPKGGPKRKR